MYAYLLGASTAEYHTAVKKTVSIESCVIKAYRKGFGSWVNKNKGIAASF
jgi:hypothetical protein